MPPVLDMAVSALKPPSGWHGRHRTLLLAAGAAAVVLGWAVLVFAVENVRFVVFAPRAKTGFEVVLASLQLLVALVLWLFPDERLGARLRWVALGFAILGLGSLGFGYLAPLADRDDPLNASMYGFLLTRLLGGLAFTAGIALPRSPALDRARAAALVGAGLVLGICLELTAGRLPDLVEITSLEEAARTDATVLHGLTAWHWLLSSLPLLLALAAAAGALWHLGDRPLGAWMTVTMTLMAGSQLHAMLWPSAYSPILTTASVLRLAFTVVAAVGAVFTLRQVAVEHAALLAAETDLARRRAEFSAMVAHELASPVTVIRGYAAMLATGELDAATQREAAAAIRGEAELLGTLIADVRDSAAQRDAFVVHRVPASLDELLAEAVAYARSLPGEHPIEAGEPPGEQVLADPDRIAQVLRNLLGNAAKYTPPGTPIGLRAERRGDRVRVMVVDHGPGITPDEVPIIFEKFGRGRAAEQTGESGAGLGLYLSRRIVWAHGGELGVEPTSGGGATFWFELRTAESPHPSTSNRPAGNRPRVR